MIRRIRVVAILLVLLFLLGSLTISLMAQDDAKELETEFLFDISFKNGVYHVNPLTDGQDLLGFTTDPVGTVRGPQVFGELEVELHSAPASPPGAGSIKWKGGKWVITTHDEAKIVVHYMGVTERNTRSTYGDLVYTAHFETDSETYDWLNYTLAVGTGTISGGPELWDLDASFFAVK